jgi:hypothetical protein
VAEGERIRVEVAFRGGQSLGLALEAEAIDQLEQAIRDGEPESISFDAEDGRYTIVVKMVAFIKRHVRESRVGFGAGA